MKRTNFTVQQLKSSKAASLNMQVIDDLEKPHKNRKKRVPSTPCHQVLWMGGQLAAWALETGIMVEREWRFHPVRKWRFDFALPDKKIGIEYDGLVSAKSRHTTLEGFTGDTDKLNAAQALGWRVLRFTVKNYKTVIIELEKNI
ncbi:PDDEXK family nuclease [Chitinophaga pinensis]|uniref:DUF559 domain-containing protein n=1 Tax=Chitinophaga pinensis (strain ATCC 43595 / DSM 2588 / LMG 13176 / NBRC 15968 / NCIMB 11800 / UQM 2034) TaxID=485918 RepID=A0A979GXP1_CHIPD|nr:hypothetical protein [Chitinophaga pinensis]ACU61310.1 hypothetical protein Cpin_3848 [Chitinophaga pinensis DSM 2588]